MQAVTRLSEVREAMAQFHKDLPNEPGLASRLGQAHAYYVLSDDNGDSRFGFSKFVGYRGLTGEDYLNNYKRLSGINTEHALKPWFDEVKPGSSTYEELYSELSDWMGQFGKRPRGGDSQHTRIMVLKPEYADESEPESDNRALIGLLIEVAKKLPVSQRAELRAAI